MQVQQKITLNDGRQIPCLGLGVWKIPAGPPSETAVLAALDAGYRHIDTAAIYGNEESVGAALRSSGIPRAEVFITTKLWNEDHKDPVRALDKSLERLKLDYVDLYLIHFPVPRRNQSWTVLERLQASGKARSIGVSNFTVRHLEELLRQSGIVPSVNQVEFHPFLNQKELLEYCRTQHIAIEAYSPLTHGQRLQDPRLLEIAGRAGRSAAQILIRWLLQHGMIVVAKSTRKERIEENGGVFDFQIPDDDMRLLDAMDENLRTCWDPTNAP